MLEAEEDALENGGLLAKLSVVQSLFSTGKAIARRLCSRWEDGCTIIIVDFKAHELGSESSGIVGAAGEEVLEVGNFLGDVGADVACHRLAQDPG